MAKYENLPDWDQVLELAENHPEAMAAIEELLASIPDRHCESPSRPATGTAAVNGPDCEEVK